MLYGHLNFSSLSAFVSISHNAAFRSEMLLHISVLNGWLCDMGQMHCGICELGQFRGNLSWIIRVENPGSPRAFHVEWLVVRWLVMRNFPVFFVVLLHKQLTARLEVTRCVITNQSRRNVVNQCHFYPLPADQLVAFPRHFRVFNYALGARSVVFGSGPGLLFWSVDRILESVGTCTFCPYTFGCVTRLRICVRKFSQIFIKYIFISLVSQMAYAMEILPDKSDWKVLLPSW